MTPDDLSALHRAAFRDERPWSAPEFDALLANPLTHLKTAPHGFALWRALAGEAELLTIAVDPAHQGRGIGNRLMAGWMADAATSCTTAVLEVASDNAAALTLYGRYCFEIVAKRKDYYHRGTARADALVLRAVLPIVGSEKRSDGIDP